MKRRRARFQRRRRRPARVGSPLIQGLAVALSLSMVGQSLGSPADVFETSLPMFGGKTPETRTTEVEDGRVSTKTGAFEYSIPIAVPPGRQGAAPDLALAYSSQAPTYGGIAAGWSLPIPSISIDSSQSVVRVELGLEEQRFVSSMSGDHILEPVTELGTPAADVLQTYRARHDDAYLRYEQLVPAASAAWRVLAPDGTTYYFGDGVYLDFDPLALTGRTLFGEAPLTRVVDRYGNTVVYKYEQILVGSDLRDFVLSEILYSYHDGMSLGAHARVVFEYSASATCSGQPLGIGAAATVRGTNGESIRFRGAMRLDAIETKVRELDTTAWSAAPIARRYELTYKSTPALCNQDHAPLRLLDKVTIKGKAGGATTFTELQPIEFEYGDYALPALTEAPQDSFDLAFPTPGWTTKGRVANGTRNWPTLDTMMLDFDGDGRLDILRIDTPGGGGAGTVCKFSWFKNTGTEFVTGGVNQSLPVPPAWSGALNDCSFVGVHTIRDNLNPPSGPGGVYTCPNEGSYLAYRFADVNGDGRPDLLTSIHHDTTFYDPGLESGNLGFGSFECPADPFECPSTDFDHCLASEHLSCDPASDFCSLDPELVVECLCDEDTVPCGSGMSYRSAGGVPPGPIEAPNPARPGCYFQEPWQVCGDAREYLWNIYLNQGGQLASTPQTLVSPIPLTSVSGLSPMGAQNGGFTSFDHGFMDLDGDGTPDGFLFTSGDQGDDDPLSWDFFPGNWDALSGTFSFDSQVIDCHGTTGVRRLPFIWSTPPHAPIAHAPYAALFDVNADGLPDLIYDQPGDGVFGIHAYWNTGRGFDLNGYPLGGPESTGGTKLDTVSNPQTLLQHTQSYDIDLDGRADWLSLLQIISGTNEQFLNRGAPPLAGASSPPSNATLIDGYLGLITKYLNGEWYVERQMVDLDNNGIPERLSYDSGWNRYEHAVEAPLRLLNKVSNGRGGKIEVLYGNSSTSSNVTAGSGTRMPASQWVVTKLRRNDGLGSTTYSDYMAYDYIDPEFGYAAADGEYRFRGFHQVHTTAADGGLGVETFDFSVDPTGRLTTTETYLSAPATLANLVSKAESEWVELSLFSGATKSFQIASTVASECAGGDCVSNRTVNVYEDLDALHWRKEVQTQHGTGNDEGDLKVETGHLLIHDATHYIVRPTVTTKSVYDGGWSEIAKSESVWSSDGLFLDEEHQYTGVVVGGVPEIAVTEFTYYPNGNLWKTRRAQQVESGSTTKHHIEYDEFFAVFPTYTRVAPDFTQAENKYLNASGGTIWMDGHHVLQFFDFGTGVVTETWGPNELNGTWDKKRSDIDGLGRPVATYVTTQSSAGVGSPYILKQTSSTTYDDGTTYPQTTTVARYIEYDGRTTTLATEVDGFGRVLSETDNIGAKKTYVYDVMSRLQSVEVPDPSQNSTSATVLYEYSYDGAGRLIAATRPDGNEVRTDYLVDALDERTIRVVGEYEYLASDPSSETSAYSDDFGRLVEVSELVDSVGTLATTSYLHDGQGNVESVTDPLGGVTTMVHDWLGRRTSITRAGQSWSYVYDLNGNKLTEEAPHTGTVGAQYIVSTVYDDLDRPVSRVVGARYHTSNAALYALSGETSFHYDDPDHESGRGRLTRIDYGGDLGSKSIFYWPEGWPRTFSYSIKVPGTSITKTQSQYFWYNAMGNPIQETTPDRLSSDYIVRNYDDRGLPYYAYHYRGSYTYLATVAHNVAGKLRARFSNYTAQAATYDYDQLGRPTAMEVVKDSPYTILAAQEFQYTPFDDVEHMQQTVGSTYYAFDYYFDERHQLRHANSGTNPTDFQADYDYDLAGRTEAVAVNAPMASGLTRDVTYSYGTDPQAVTSLDHVGSSGSLAAYEYDEAGNVIERETATDKWEFIYDAANQLRDVTRRTPSGTFVSREVYYYDESGQRILIVSKSSTGSNTGIRWFIGGVENVYSGTGSTQPSENTIMLSGQAVAKVRATGSFSFTVKYLYHNHLQHLLVATNSSNAIDAGFIWGPYGELLHQTGATTDYKRRFNDKYLDTETGLSYYGQRYYDPLALAWTQADPKFRFRPDAALLEPRRANLYTFSLNNPMSYVDPDGLNPYANARKPSKAEYVFLASVLSLASKGGDAEKAVAVRVVARIYGLDDAKVKTLRFVDTFDHPDTLWETLTGAGDVAGRRDNFPNQPSDKKSDQLASDIAHELHHLFQGVYDESMGLLADAFVALDEVEAYSSQGDFYSKTLGNGNDSFAVGIAKREKEESDKHDALIERIDPKNDGSGKKSDFMDPCAQSNYSREGCQNQQGTDGQTKTIRTIVLY